MPVSYVHRVPVSDVRTWIGIHDYQAIWRRVLKQQFDDVMADHLREVILRQDCPHAVTDSEEAHHHA